MNLRLLRVRKKLNSKRPKFLRTETWKKKSFQNDPKWRKPRGKDNKMRMKRSGKQPLVSVGYRGPKEVRGTHASGLKEVMITNPGQLDGLENVIIRINATVGNKKKIEIVKKAVKSNLKIANPALTYVKVTSVEEFDAIEHIKDHIQKLIVPLRLDNDIRSEIVRKAEDVGILVEE
jgi:large subunit ribosomal protein L32e